MAGHGDYSDAHDAKYRYVDVPLHVATDENIRPYGRLVHDFHGEEVWVMPWPSTGKRPVCKGTGIGGGIVEGRVRNFWQGEYCKQSNKARPDGEYQLGRLPPGTSKRTHVLTREMNYHPDGGQVFFPTARNAYVMILALPGDDCKPEDYVAFYFDGTCGLQIRERIWHNAPYQLDDECHFDGKQNAVRACVFQDLAHEFGVYLKTPLLPELAQK